MGIRIIQESPMQGMFVNLLQSIHDLIDTNPELAKEKLKTILENLNPNDERYFVRMALGIVKAPALATAQMPQMPIAQMQPPVPITMAELIDLFLAGVDKMKNIKPKSNIILAKSIGEPNANNPLG